MTTPTFISSTVGFGAIRYYSQFDPYFFSVDNRPLVDLATNDAMIAIAGDAARRAVMMEQIGTSTFSLLSFGVSRYLLGLAVSNPSANILRVGPGLEYESLPVNASDSRTIIKRAVFPFSADFSVPSPGGGNSVVYLVQGKYVDFGSTNPATTSNYPVWDGTNNYLPTTLLNGELQISVLSGSAAVTGTEVIPTPTSGWFPIYNATVVGAATSFTAVYNAAAPLSAGLSRKITNFVNTGGSSTVVVGDTPASQLANATTSGVIFDIPIDTNINPYKPIKFTFGYSPTVTSNAVAMRVKWQAVGNTDVINGPSYTIATQDNVPISGAADTYNVYTTINAVISSAVIQAAIAASKIRFTVVVERLGADGADNNTGSFRLIDLTAIQ